MCGVFLDKFHTLQDPRQSTLRDVFHSPVPDADLMEARAELQSFAAGMGKQGPEPSTAPPSEAETYQGPQHMHHEVTREKRVEPDGERPPAKFAKGDAKGEPPPSGKGGPAPFGTQQHANSGTVKPAEPQPSQDVSSQGRDNSQLRRNGRQSNQHFQWGTSSWNKDQLVEENTRVRNLLIAVARLEDTISIQQLDVEVLIFMQTPASGNSWSIAEKLHEVGLSWHRKRRQTPRVWISR